MACVCRCACCYQRLRTSYAHNTTLRQPRTPPAGTTPFSSHHRLCLYHKTEMRHGATPIAREGEWGTAAYSLPLRASSTPRSRHKLWGACGMTSHWTAPSRPWLTSCAWASGWPRPRARPCPGPSPPASCHLPPCPNASPFLLREAASATGAQGSPRKVWH